jgi:hypothetical protein
MAGAALSRMWDTNPRLACFLQSALCLMVAAFEVRFLTHASKDWTVIIILAVFLLIEGGSLIGFTIDAVKHDWRHRDW